MQCDECGEQIDIEGDEGTAADGGAGDADAAADEEVDKDAFVVCPRCGYEQPLHRRAPWGFKLFLVATVIYLGYRAYQGIGWLVHHV